jgi:hypothetical protein
MSADDLLAFIQKRPFVPIRLCLTDGSTYEVRHPELLMPGRRTVIVGLPADPNRPVFDQTVTVALVHVVQVIPLDQASVSSNGA